MANIQNPGTRDHFRLTPTLTKNADPDKYKYIKYGIGFDSCSQSPWSDGGDGKNVLIFGVDNSSSVHIDVRNKNILVLGE